MPSHPSGFQQLRTRFRTELRPGVLSRETEAATQECSARQCLRVWKGHVTLCVARETP